MAYSDSFNIRTRFVKFNDVADAIDGTITRQAGGTTQGSSTAYTASPLPAWSSPIAPGSYITFIPHLTNGANATLTVSNIGPSLLKRAGVNISVGALTQGVPYLCLYTGAYWEVVSSTETPATQFLPLTLDKVNNRVGVNSTSPQAVMDVYSASSSVAHLAVRGLQTESFGSGVAAIQIDVNGKGGFAIQNNATGGTRKLQIASNNGYGSGTAVFFTATSGGAVGVNNNDPSAALHVHSLNSDYSGLGNVVSIHSLSDAHASVILGVQNGNAPYIAAGKMTNGTGTFTSLRFKTSNIDRLIIDADGAITNSGSMVGQAFFTDRPSTLPYDYSGYYCRVDGSNNGGIRLNSVHVQLEVWSAGDLIMVSSGKERGRFGTDGLAVKGGVYVESDRPTVFLRDDSHRSSMLHCNSNKFFLLRGTGVNSVNWIDEVYPLVVDLETKGALFGGSVKAAGGFVVSDSQGSTSYGELFASTYTLSGVVYNQHSISASGTNMLHLNTSNGRLRVNISANNDSGYFPVVYDTGSDRLFYRSSSIRYKTDVEDIEPQYIENLYRFRPVWYRYKPELPDNAHPHWSEYGLIAEESLEIEPRIVGLKYSDDSYEENSNTLKPGAEPYPETILYEQLIPLLVAGLQAHKKEMDLMKARLAALEESLGMP